MFVKYPRDFNKELQWDGHFPVPCGDFVQTEGLLRQPVPPVRPPHPGLPRAGGVGLSLEELFGQPWVERGILVNICYWFLLSGLND